MSKAEKTKEFIIEKTATLFNRKGYAGTSLNDIIAETGLTKGSIYGNFENKEAVAVAVFQHNLKKLSDNFNKEFEKKHTYKDKLLSYPEPYKEYFYQLMEIGGCPIQNTAIEADDTHPILKEMANKAIMAWKNQIIDLIEKGIATGEFKAADINPEQTALTIIATIEGAIMISRLSGKINNLNIIMKSVSKMIEDLV